MVDMPDSPSLTSEEDSQSRFRRLLASGDESSDAATHPASGESEIPPVDSPPEEGNLPETETVDESEKPSEGNAPYEQLPESEATPPPP